MHQKLIQYIYFLSFMRSNYEVPSVKNTGTICSDETGNTWSHTSPVNSHMHWGESDPGVTVIFWLIALKLLCRNIFHGRVQTLLKRRLLCASCFSSQSVIGPHSVPLPTSQSRKGQRKKTGTIWDDCWQLFSPIYKSMRMERGVKGSPVIPSHFQLVPAGLELWLRKPDRHLKCGFLPWRVLQGCARL